MLFWKLRGASGRNLRERGRGGRDRRRRRGARRAIRLRYRRDRNGHGQALRDAGADVVVTDLAQVCVAMDAFCVVTCV